MAINPYVFFHGNCREAVSFYAEVFGTEEPRIMTYGQSPVSGESPLPEHAKQLVMHTNLTISGTLVMFSDVLPGMPYNAGNAVALVIMTEDEQLIRSAYAKLSDGGTVMMELQETFWSPCYGMLTDKFGVHWQFSLQQ